MTFSTPQLLAIDAGNTRTKWALFDPQGNLSQQSACLNTEIHLVNFAPLVQQAQRMIIANVAGAGHAQKLLQQINPHLSPQHPAIEWLSASQAACGVINHYTAPETLGVDRWAALIAAQHLHHSPSVVVNAGTAVTIDALKPSATQAQQSEFIGGMIIPGLSLMPQSLGKATAQLPHYMRNVQLSINPFATNTQAAIYAGAMHAITGAIEHMAASLENASQQAPTILLSGGDAAAIQAYFAQQDSPLANRTRMVDNLVLRGLFFVSRHTSVNGIKS